MYTLEGMTCEECAKKVRLAFKARPEVIEAQVLLSDARAIVSLRESLSTEALNTALREEGHYSATEIPDAHPAQAAKAKKNTPWLKFLHRKKPCCR